jgi:hypothetical protein
VGSGSGEAEPLGPEDEPEEDELVVEDCCEGIEVGFVTLGFWTE